MRATAAVPAGLALAALLAGCAGAGGSRSPQAAAAAAPAAVRAGAEAGIEVTAVRVSAAGRLVDFRYRVTDTEKARQVLGRQVEPYAIDQATGVRLGVPRAGKVGALRQSAVRAEAGRVYFILFGNAGRVVRPGSRLTVVIGDIRIVDLPVE